MSEVWEQREDVRKELRLIRKSLERIDSLSQSMLKMQRLMATNMGKLTEIDEVDDIDPPTEED